MMSTRTVGVVLIAVGLIGLVATMRFGPTGPGVWGAWGPGWMGPMHAWMIGSASWGQSPEDPVAGAAEARVTATEFSFSPSEISITGGQAVNVVLVNDGDVVHDLVVPSLGFRVVASAGGTRAGSLSGVPAGTYEFLCSVPGHAEAGMRGVLTVA